MDWLEELVAASAVTYLVELVVVAVDGFFPLVPGETVVITAGVVAGQGGLSIFLVIAAAMVGAVLGDNVSYLLGAHLGRRAARRLFRAERAKARLRWAERQVQRRSWIISVARFVPGGRTAVTFAAGTFDVTWRRFMVFDVAGALAWATYAGMLGFLGGRTFKENLWLPLLVSLAIAAILTLAAEVLRRLAMRRKRAGTAA